MWEKTVLSLLSNAFKFTFEGHINGPAQCSKYSWTSKIRRSALRVQSKCTCSNASIAWKGALGRSLEGSGIGLALVQELVNLRGGSVSVRSTPGHGSTFTVRIPTGTKHLPAERNVFLDLDGSRWTEFRGGGVGLDQRR